MKKISLLSIGWLGVCLLCLSFSGYSTSFSDPPISASSTIDAARSLHRYLPNRTNLLKKPLDSTAKKDPTNEFPLLADFNLNAGLDGTTINLDCTTSHNLFDSGGEFGDFSNNEDYSVTFCNTTPGETVLFALNSFAINAGENFYIYDGENTSAPQFADSPLDGSESSPTLFQIFNSTGSCLTFRFETGTMGPTSDGFSASVSCKTSNMLTSCAGTFTDPGGAAGDYFFGEQTTTICSDNSGQLVVDFTLFDIEFSYDFLRIHDGNSTSASQIAGSPFTGTTSPGIVTATGTCLTFDFQADQTIFGPGWNANISCIGGGPVGDADYTMDDPTQIDACTGIFADSGDTTTDYGDNESFTKTFCSDQNNQISFSFEHFNLAAGDVLEVFDGNSTAATSLGTFTGAGAANSPGVITASSTCLTFEFTSNGSGTSTGWEASINCTGTPAPTALGSSWTGYPSGSACGGNEEIAGTAFEDIDQDGQRDTGEPILPGVSVSIYDDSGLFSGPIMTDANGEYSFTGLAAGAMYRLEFGTLPGLNEGPHGPGSSTAVQFVDAGSCDVNYGLVDPSHYCNTETDPLLVVPCYVSGDPQHISNINASGVVTFDYSASGNSPHPTYTNIATAGAVGSIWGVAHNPVSNTNYYGTVLKRHVGLGPGGIGAIYSQQESDPNTVAPVFYDFGALAGTVASNSARFPGSGSAFGFEGPCGACDNIDPSTFSQIGKVGIGDVEVGPDNEYVYATNLSDRKVYKINADSPAPGSASPLPNMPWIDNSVCNNGVARPWALEFRRGNLYVGVVCDASSSSCPIGSACSDLTATVYSFDGTSWTTELSFPLDYYREPYASGSDYFVRWIDDWNTMEPFVGFVTDANFGQPIVMDIEFDDDNSIILGIGDRSGLQMGYQAPNPTAGSGDTSERNFAFGDILRAAYNPGTGTYTLENNGVVGGLTTTNPNGASGPGGRSFYWGDYFTGIGAERWQSGLGPLALLPCSEEVLFPVADAIDYYSNGIAWMSNTTGQNIRRLEVYQGSFDGSSANFAKGVGLGDLGFIREDPANIEIGNIVWWDENANGRQDPSEPGVPDVAIELWKSNGSGGFSQVAATTTDALGRYIFSSSSNSNGLNTENWSFTADDAVMINTSYELRIASWASDAGLIAYSTGLGYTGHLISVANNQGPTGTQRDSDGVDVSGIAVVTLTTGDPSENGHSYDFAFYGQGGCEAPGVVPTANTPCTGENLELMAAVSGGEMPYTYNWTGPNGFTSDDQNPVITNIDATLDEGTYSLTVTDAFGCTEEVSIEVYINELTIALAPTDANCGSGDGEIDLTTTGEAPFMINWNNDGTADPNDDPEDLTGLSGGNYTVIVIDADGCQQTESASIDESGAPTLSASPTPATCGMANGSIDLMVSGIAATNIDWDNDGTMGDSDPEDISGLAPGTYMVVVTGSGGCEALLSVTIDDLPGPTSSFTQVNAACSMANGSIDLMVEGGTMPYEYDWDGDMAFDDSEDLSGLSPGTYTVVVRDANACTTTETVTITGAEGPTLTVDGMDETCSAFNGSIELTVNGGTPPFIYDWDNDGTGDNDDPEDPTGLPAGTYTVVVTDDNGCTDQISVTLTNAPGITELQLVPTDATFCSQTDGSIALTVIGGTSPYAYDWNNDGEPAPDFDAEDLTGVPQGTYTVTVTDANNCPAIGTAIVGLQTGAELDVVITEPTTCAETGSVDLMVSGGAAPLSFLWSNGETTEDVSGLESGIYSVTVTEANGCEVTRNISIRDIREPILSVVVTEPSCGMSDGAIDLTISDPDGMMTPFTINWEDGPTTEDRTGLAAGTYTVTVENGLSCISSLTVNLNAAAAPAISISQINESCSEANGAIDMTIAGGSPAYMIDWNLLPDVEDHINLSAGTYNVTVTDMMGCDATATVTLSNSEPPTLSANLDEENCEDMDGAIDLVVDGIGPFLYDWDIDGTTDNDEEEDQSGLGAGTYAVTVTDFNGCMAMESFELDASCPCDITITATDISSCNANEFDATIILDWIDGPTTGDFEYSIDGGPYLPLARSNFAANVTGETIVVPDLVCNEVKMIVIRFEDVRQCFEEIMFVFPPSDPAGYFYCVETGEIITGGSIEVIPPAGGSLVINEDGSSGRYSWVVTGSPVTEGIYTMNYTPPTGYTITGTPGDRAGDTDDILDPSSASEDNPGNADPLLIGSDVDGTGTALIDFSAATNPYFLVFDLEQSDPFVDLNNLPLEGCTPCSVEAGFGPTICSTATIDLTTMGAEISTSLPDPISGEWTTTGTGEFDDTNTTTGIFGVATSYIPSAADIANGQVTLTLTATDPDYECIPNADEVTIVILQVGCGTFPWDGN